MPKLKLIEITTPTLSGTTDSELNSQFLIEPLNTGYGITLGNLLRRILLSELITPKAVGIRLNDITHEFMQIEYLKEDLFELLLNVKEINFQSITSDIRIPVCTGFLNIQGPQIVTAGLFQLPHNTYKIINPELYLGTILTNSFLTLEIDILQGKNFKLLEDNLQTGGLVMPPFTIPIDANFIPIKTVNFNIRLIYDNFGYLKESLYLEIRTNGSITPKRSLQTALKSILTLITPLFLQP